VFLGVTSTELLIRFYSFVVAARFGAGALAILAATQVFMRPIPLLATVWSVVARVDLARQREQGDWRAYGRTTLMALAVGAPIAAVWTAAVVLEWPAISHFAYGGKYAAFAWLAGAWGVSAALSFGQAVVSSALLVLRRFRALALANTAASVVAAMAILLVVGPFGYGGALGGTIAGQALEMAIMCGLLAMALRGQVVVGQAIAQVDVGADDQDQGAEDRIGGEIAALSEIVHE
jgi:O-antigen/teichoic acid export membrane protein